MCDPLHSVASILSSIEIRLLMASVVSAFDMCSWARNWEHVRKIHLATSMDEYSIVGSQRQRDFDQEFND